MPEVVRGKIVEVKEPPRVVADVVRSGCYQQYIASISNSDLSANPTRADIPAVFVDNRRSALLPGPPSDWILSVTRFTLPSMRIPVQLFPTIDTTINVSPYAVALRWNGNVVVVPLIWTPEASPDTVRYPPAYNPITNPLTAAQKQKYFVPYYSMYSIQNFVQMINTALNASYTFLINPPYNMPPSAPPIFAYDGINHHFSMSAPAEYLDSAATPINILFNADLWGNFMASFNAFEEPSLGGGGWGNQLSYRFVMTDLLRNREILPYPGGDQTVYVMKQEFPALSLLYSFQSIVLASSTMHTPSAWTQSNGQPNAQNFCVLTDFEVQYENGFDLKNFVQYVPTAEYRRIELQGDDPIMSVDLQFYWRAKNSPQLIPVQLPFYTLATVLLQFEKR